MLHFCKTIHYILYTESRKQSGGSILQCVCLETIFFSAAALLCGRYSADSLPATNPLSLSVPLDTHLEEELTCFRGIVSATMTSIWKLVEAELSPEIKARLESAEKIEDNNKQSVGSGHSSRSKRSSHRHRYNRDKQRYNQVFIPDTPETREYYAKLAVEQMYVPIIFVY